MRSRSLVLPVHAVLPVGVPISVLSDSYKATHFLQYPKAQKMVAYGEFRQGFNKDKTDTRMVAYGIRYLVENYIAKPWTMEDVDMHSSA